MLEIQPNGPVSRFMSKSRLSDTSVSFLEAAKAHDDKAWRRLTVIYGPTVYEWGRKNGLQPSDAADVTQEVFQAIFLKLYQFKPDGKSGSFRRWLWTIHRNKLMDFYRRNNRIPAVGNGADLEHVAEPPARNSLSEPESDDTQQRVLRILKLLRNEFKDNAWQAFWRSAVLGERTVDIAKSLDMSSAAVCMCRSRVLKRLRDRLAGLGEFAQQIDSE